MVKSSWSFPTSPRNPAKVPFELKILAPLKKFINDKSSELISLYRMVADLSSQQSIRHLVQEFTERHTQLHVLVNNVGVTLPKRSVTVDGLETVFATNHLAPFLLTNLMLPLLSGECARSNCDRLFSGAGAGEDQLRRPAK
ncbi:MAG TPA: hypothetical protein DCL75_05870 [Ktedonobacter sp.]|nr:hypothetical protein [Ktedonobacter sp.]